MKKLLKKKEIAKKAVEPAIILVKKACPFCENDVKGNEKIHFYCKNCNFLFRKKDLKSPDQSSKE